MLDKRCYSTGHIYFLENVLAQLMTGNLAGDGYHGNGIHICGSNASDQVSGTRTGGHHADTYLAAGAGITAGHMAGILLRAHQGILNVGCLQRVHCLADGGTGITKHMSHSLAS